MIDDSPTHGDPGRLGTTAIPTDDRTGASALIQQRPALRPAGLSAGAPGSAWVFTGAGESAELPWTACWSAGGTSCSAAPSTPSRITACTLDPGHPPARPAPPAPPAATPLATAVDGQPLRTYDQIWIEADTGAAPASPPPGSPPGPGGGAIRQLLVDHSIIGPIRTRYGGSVETLTITDSIVQAIPATTGPEYTAADIYDPALLASSLKANDPLSQALLAALPAPARAALQTYRPPASVPPAVVDGLNHLVTGPSLWDPTRFAMVPLSPDLLALTSEVSSPPSSASVTLNRGLLEPLCRWRSGSPLSRSATPR